MEIENSVPIEDKIIIELEAINTLSKELYAIFYQFHYLLIVIEMKEHKEY
jgi:hypothetical protein